MGCGGAHLAAVGVDEPEKRQNVGSGNSAPSNLVQHSKIEGPRAAATTSDYSKPPSLPTLPPPPVIREQNEDTVRSLPELPPPPLTKDVETTSRSQGARDEAVSNALQEPSPEPSPEDCFESMLGAICTTPRGSKPRHESSKPAGSNKGHISRAFDALQSPDDQLETKAAGNRHMGKAFAALGEESDEEELEGLGGALKVEVVPLCPDTSWKEGTSRRCGSPITWPRDVDVSSGSRVLVLTWARWARNSLRIKEEIKLKALQHVKYPKTPYHHRSLSPQPTPRGDATDRESQAALGVLPDALSQTRAAVGSSKRHPAMASRSRGGAPPQGRLLFDVMADERRDAADAEGVRLKLQKMAIEERHTESSSKTPGFGVDTPNFLEHKSSASRMSPMDSVASSGLSSPLAAGQLSPWLLEAEALISEQDEPALDCPPPTRTKGWFHAPSQLYDLPEVRELELNDGELDDFIDDEDELDKVVIFNTCGVSGGSGSDSLASTATSPAMPSGIFASNTDKQRDQAIGDNHLANASHQKSASNASLKLPSYAIGERVSYWSGSRGVWLPAVIVEKKSDNVYLIDKQMKGCLAKVRTSELISRAEEKRNPVLAAFATLERDSNSTPRGGKSPRKTGSSPRGSRSQPTGEKASSRPSAIGSGSGSVRELPPLQHERNSPRNFLSSSKAPAVVPEVPRALAQLASTSPAGTPRSRGKIVRDDFSDDSDDD
mmetsp:Transcript_27364/g.43835  ORF Transcript_27364/g.43835 Transcript_27364/m.43835 type:complete len:719 (+) Transcript_27364:235-2391(+)